MFAVVGLLIICSQIDQTQATPDPGLVLPKERTTGLGCIPEGRTVSYQCTVTDTTGPPPIGSTIWSGTALQCASASNQISLQHSQFSPSAPVSQTCSGITARSLEVNGTNFVSNLSLTASAELNGTTLTCSLSKLTEIGSDILSIGSSPPLPGQLSISFSSETSLTVSWSPPSGPVEGGVGGYVFGVTGEGCGCVSMNVSGNTTSVTCSGWTAADQTCSFEVRTISQECGFASDPVNEEIVLQATCDSKILGEEFPAFSNLRAAKTSNGAIVYNGTVVGSTGYLICEDGFKPDADSIKRHCMSDGSWSGKANCVPVSPFQKDWAALLVLLFPTLMFIIGVLMGCSPKIKQTNCGIRVLQIFTFGGLKVGMLFAAWRTKHSSTNYSSNQLNFVTKQDASGCFSRPIDAVVDGDIAYFRAYRTRDVYVCDSNNHSWSKLPNKCEADDTSLVILPVGEHRFLHTIGGLNKENQLIGELYYYNILWKYSTLSAMSVKRKQVTAVYRDKELIAAGGRGEHGPLKTVEILNLPLNQWSIVADLPQAIFRASGLICKHTLYILGGRIYDKERHVQVDVNIAYKVSLAKLSHSKERETGIFKTIKQVPGNILSSAYTTIGDRIYAVGGSENDDQHEEAICSRKVFEYDPRANNWKRTTDLNKPGRCYCFAVSFENPYPHIMVVGGYTQKTDEGITKSVEIARVGGNQQTEIDFSLV